MGDIITDIVVVHFFAGSRGGSNVGDGLGPSRENDRRFRRVGGESLPSASTLPSGGDGRSSGGNHHFSLRGPPGRIGRNDIVVVGISAARSAVKCQHGRGGSADYWRRAAVVVVVVALTIIPPGPRPAAAVAAENAHSAR